MAQRCQLRHSTVPPRFGGRREYDSEPFLDVRALSVARLVPESIEFCIVLTQRVLRAPLKLAESVAQIFVVAHVVEPSVSVGTQSAGSHIGGAKSDQSAPTAKVLLNIGNYPSEYTNNLW